MSFVICHSSFASSSSLEGIVTIWGSGAPVAGATIEVSGEDRPVMRQAVADASGKFRLPLLPPGRYAVTASLEGYSTVTLVGVRVHPGETRHVALQVAVADEDESVTETVSDTMFLEGVSAGWVVSPGLGEELPLRRGRIGETAALFPGAGFAGEGGGLPVEAAGLTSVVREPMSSETGGASAGLVVALPRTGMDGLQGSVRLAYGRRVSADPSPNDWTRGGFTAGAHNGGRSLTGFLSLDHADEPLTSWRRTGIAASVGVRPATSHALSATVDVATANDDIEDRVARDTWLVRVIHSMQVGRRSASQLAVAVEGDVLRVEDRTGSAEAIARSRVVRIEERLGFALSAAQEIRGGLSLRTGLDDRVTLALPGERLTRDAPWDATAAWLEDEIATRFGRIRVGARVEQWAGPGLDEVEVSPRVELARELGDGATVMRAGWGRFHELRDPVRAIHDSGFGLSPALLDRLVLTRNDRTSIGIERDLSGLAGVTLDVASSRLRDLARPDAVAQVVEATLGGRASIFGKVDAIAFYTWSDVELPAERTPAFDIAPDGVPRHRGSLALRASLPRAWVASVAAGYRSGAAIEPGDGSSTTLDIALARTFSGNLRAALEIFDATDDAETGRSIALNLLARF